jgi:hypothetical protein
MKLRTHCFTAALAILLAQPFASVHLTAQQPGGDLALAELPEAPQPQLADNHATTTKQASENVGGVGGTVTDVYGDLVPGATVVLDGLMPQDHRTVVADDNAAFSFNGLKAGVPYRVSIDVKGFSKWTSAPMVLTTGQYVFVKDIQLKVEAEQSSVTVYASTSQIAVEQVKLAEQQRVLGIIPNFYVVYDSKNAVPLTAKLKFKLALKVSTDPVTMAGVAFMASVNQAADTPDYVQGAKGYGQRLGAVAGGGFSDIMIGGAILPSLLHQDPRYFYKGEGSTKSRLIHALSNPFICRGDNGRLQPNYSSVGGDILSSTIENTYYPDSNRGAGMVFGTFAINTAERLMSGIAQEFILPRLTPGVRK